MKIYTILVTFLVCSLWSANGAAVSDDSSSINLGSVLKNYYEALRNIMPCGVESMKIPALAPFKLDKWSYNYQNEQVDIQALLDNIEITGLDNFRILNSDFDADTGVLSLDLFHPEVQVISQFSLDQVFEVFGVPIEAPAEGLLNFKIADHRHTIECKLLLSESGVQIQDYQSKTSVGDIKVNNYNNYWSKNTNNLVNRILREIAFYAIEEFQPYMNKQINNQALPQLNAHLANVTLSSIVSTMSDITTQLKSVECKNSN